MHLPHRNAIITVKTAAVALQIIKKSNLHVLHAAFLQPDMTLRTLVLQTVMLLCKHYLYVCATGWYVYAKSWLCDEVCMYWFTFLSCVWSTAGAYYPAQPQFTPSVQAAPVIMNPAPQQQQPPPQPPQHIHTKRERKQVQSAFCCTKHVTLWNYLL